MEAKNPALLSNRDGYLLELTGWTKGSLDSDYQVCLFAQRTHSELELD